MERSRGQCVNRLPDVSEVVIDRLPVGREHLGANTLHLSEEVFYLFSVVDD